MSWTGVYVVEEFLAPLIAVKASMAVILALVHVGFEASVDYNNLLYEGILVYVDFIVFASVGFRNY